MEEAWIGRPTDGLRVRAVDVESDGTVVSVDVLLRSPGLEACLVAFEPLGNGFAGLSRFFSSLERDWRGWAGERTFESLEGEFFLSAVHDGHVRLGVTLRQADEPHGWQVQKTLQLEAGEELTAAAVALRSLLNGV